MNDLNKAELKAKLKEKTNSLVTGDKELFATLSKWVISEKKKERANNFRKENRDLLDEYIKLWDLEIINKYKEMFMEKKNTNIVNSNIKSEYIRRELSTRKSVNEPGWISEIMTSDENEDVQLIALENRNRVRWWMNWGWVRYTHIISLDKWNKNLFVNSVIVRDEFESYKDKPDQRIRNVKILEVKDNKITIGIETSGGFEVKIIDAKTRSIIKNYYINYAEQQEIMKNKIQTEFDRDPNDLKYNIKNINEVIGKKYNSKIIEEVEPWTYIVLGMNEDDKWRVKDADCYLLKDWREKFKKININMKGLNQHTFGGQYPTIRKKIKINSSDSSNDNINIDVDFILEEGSYYQQDYRYREPSKLDQKNFKISLEK